MFENLSHLLYKTENMRFLRVRQWRHSREVLVRETFDAQNLSQEAVSREIVVIQL